MKLRIGFWTAVGGLLLGAGPARAEVLAGWYFENFVPPGDEMQLPDTGVFGGFARRYFTTQPAFFNPVGNGSPRGWSSGDWAAGDAIEFWTGSSAHQQITIEWDQARNGSGPNVFDLLWSTDATTYHSLLDDYSVQNNGAPNAPWSAGGGRNPVYTRSVTLPAAASDSATLILRLEAQQSAFAGSIVVDNIIIRGTPIPEPAAGVGLLLLGLLRRR